MDRRNWIQQSFFGAASLAIPINFTDNICRWIDADINIKSDQWLRLNWNENPYGPSETAKIAMTEALQSVNHYPDPLITQLKEDLAAKFQLSPANFLITSGSTEILCLLGMYAGLNNGEILTPWPSFPTMLIYGHRWGASSKKVALSEDYRIDFNLLKDSISSATKVISICNPNNPTSTEVDRSELIAFCQAVPEDVLICVDEAYIHFSKDGEEGSLADLVKSRDNIVVVRTFSKAYGLAGLRLGYAISHTSNIEKLQHRHTGLDFSISSVSLSAAMASMNDSEFIKNCVVHNQQGRNIVFKAFDNWDVAYADSATNFIYADAHRFDPNIVSNLREKNILITKWPDMKDHIRISIQTPEEMAVFVNEVEAYLV